MKSEFNLSDKIHEISYDECIDVKDVKEFIRLVKQNPDKIDELAGEKLI